jgi:nitrate/TMAO reductase-like tetraheme cytochrome c subunit
LKSPVNRRNLATTCGTCHTGPLIAFQKSKHYELLQSASSNGPTCSTCHGEVDGRVLSAKALASECSDCHGPGERAPRSERARQVREQYEALAVVREQMKLAQSLIKRVDDKTRRASLTEAYQQAEVPLRRAVDAGHQFVYGDLREYLAVARTRVEALLSSMANR